MRDRENHYLNYFRPIIEKKYAGEWIVIEQNKIISHAVSPLDAYINAKNKGIKVPYIIYIDKVPKSHVRIGI